MKDSLLKSSLIIPAIGLFVLGGVFTQAAFADTGNATSTPSGDQSQQEGPHHGFWQGLTDQQKTTLKEAHTLFKEGKSDEAQALLQSAGIPMPPHKLAMEGLTDEQKIALEKAQALRESGDQAGARSILEAAGIPLPPFHHGHGPHNNDNDSDDQSGAPSTP